MTARPDRLILVGFMGSGKTTVGRHVAALLGWTFIDTDEAIVLAAGCSIAELFEAEGEPAFRRREADIVAGAVARRLVVVALGGGALERDDTDDLVRSVGLLVYLRASRGELLRRVTGLQAEARPLWREGFPDELFERRRARYEVADLTVETDGKTPETIAREIQTWRARWIETD